MKYMGSKARIAHIILPIMLKNRTKNQTWVEPFVGGGNIIEKVDGRRIGADSNKWVIEALIAIRDHVKDLPKNNKEFTIEDYKKLKYSDDYKYKGYAGFAFSYGGKWMGGWCRDKQGKRDYVAEAYRNAVKQSPLLQGAELIHSNYSDLSIPNNSIIYCDPPYQGTTKYKDNFDHDAFWVWCRNMNNNGHEVFISEYKAPDDFEQLWEGTLPSSLTQNTGSRIGVERLFKAPNNKSFKNFYKKEEEEKEHEK